MAEHTITIVIHTVDTTDDMAEDIAKGIQSMIQDTRDDSDSRLRRVEYSISN